MPSGNEPELKQSLTIWVSLHSSAQRFSLVSSAAMPFENANNASAAPPLKNARFLEFSRTVIRISPGHPCPSVLWHLAVCRPRLGGVRAASPRHFCSRCCCESLAPPRRSLVSAGASAGYRRRPPPLELRSPPRLRSLRTRSRRSPPSSVRRTAAECAGVRTAEPADAGCGPAARFASMLASLSLVGPA